MKETSKWHIYVAIIIIVIASASIGTYYWFFRTPEKPLKLMPLRVGHLLADELHQPSWCVANETGYIEGEGFKAFHNEYINGPDEMAHFAAGELDVAYVGAAPFLSARAGGVDIIAVASSNTEGSSLVVAEEITSVIDLNGTTVGSPGLGTIQDYMLTRIEEQRNITLDHFVATVTTLIQHFEAGDIVGYIAWEPHASNAVVRPIPIRGAHILLTSHDILPGHQCCVLAVRGDWVREAPHIVRRVVRWHMKAQKWVLEHPDDAEDIMASYSGLPISLIREAHPIVQHPYPPYVDLPSCKIMTEGLIATNKIKSETVPDVDEFLNESIDNSFVEDLDKELRPPTLQGSYKIGFAPLKFEATLLASVYKSIPKSRREY